MGKKPEMSSSVGLLTVSHLASTCRMLKTNSSNSKRDTTGCTDSIKIWIVSVHEHVRHQRNGKAQADSVWTPKVGDTKCPLASTEGWMKFYIKMHNRGEGSQAWCILEGLVCPQHSGSLIPLPRLLFTKDWQLFWERMLCHQLIMTKTIGHCLSLANRKSLPVLLYTGAHWKFAFL